MKATRLIGALVVLALVLGTVFAVAVTLRDDGSAEPGRATLAPTPAPEDGSSEPPAPDLSAFYGQTLDWAFCPGSEEDECATLTVPLDYQDPGGRTLDLAVLKVPAEKPDERIGSMVVDPGGPGAPATTYASDGGWGDALREHFDIVGMDPRGVGQSDPVDCLSDADMDAFLAGDPDPDTPAEELAYAASVKGFGAGCEKNSGALAAHVSTIEAARDMDVLRSALGENHLTYFGASYGTELGATYAEFFPQQVGRLVLDGAVDPTLGLVESAKVQAGGFETALRSYVQHCVDGGDCPLGDSVDAGVTRVQQFLADTDQQPLGTRLGDRKLTEGLAYYGIGAALYSEEAWSLLDRGFNDAIGDGDGTVLALLADLYADRNVDGTYKSNLLEAFPTISCLDKPESVPFDQVEKYVPELEAVSPTWGRTYAWGLTTCAGYTARSTETPRPLRGAGAAPIVVIGTTRDPATPFSEAQALASQLQSAVLVSRDGDGHTAYSSGNQCIADAVEDYLVDGTVPQDGLQC
ncbi:alpha/beta hydrolase [Nocardioides anomalus]|uniref:Alpha/beta hydrolase n=1 Tax=Nocardioides anomalus TaxID=2712223 RepID=A0A6G6WI35_9ACTN|nr:alpha/beta hydrolase [Nocardioides anomalus]QIG44879.1 alpha/beta hydrolase [Nocardioides anomalus]